MEDGLLKSLMIHSVQVVEARIGCEEAIPLLVDLRKKPVSLSVRLSSETSLLVLTRDL